MVSTVSRAAERVSRSRSDLSARVALLVFVVAGISMVVAVPMVALHQWFFNDEWDFLATRFPSNASDLLRPHGGHWSTLPILFYQGLLAVFGLRTYLPYQLPVDVLHFVAAALLRVVMRRAGVGPWIATSAAGLYALFGSGYEDIAWAFQVGFVGALVLGLTQLILADHDGPIDRRDWLGLSAGAVALLVASGLAIVMVAVVGVATLLRRGSRVAAFHTVPLALIYALWWLNVGRHYPSQTGSGVHLPLDARWVYYQTRGAFDAMGQVPGLGVVLGGVLVVGLVLAWRARNAKERRTLSAMGALLIGASIFLGVSAWQRASPDSFGYATASHLLDIFTALVLPGIAVAADAIARRWRILLPAMLALFVISIPGNVQKLVGPNNPYQASTQTALRNGFLAIADLPITDSLPRSYQLTQNLYPYVTVGWLLDQKALGRLPSPTNRSPLERANLTLSLVLKQSTGSPTTQACRSLVEPIRLPVQKGESFYIGGGRLEVHYVTSEVVSRPMTFYPFEGRKLTVLAGPLTLMFASSDVSVPASLCQG